MKKKAENNQVDLQFGEFGRLVIVMLVCIIISFFVDNNFIEDLLFLLPQINGILIAGVLTSLAVAFTIFNKENIVIVHDNNDSLKSMSLFNEELKNDAILVLLSFSISVIIIIISKIMVVSSILGSWFWFAIGIFCLSISISSIYDIISSIFTLNKIKINSYKNNGKN